MLISKSSDTTNASGMAAGAVLFALLMIAGHFIK
jgi:hypothetical protein